MEALTFHRNNITLCPSDKCDQFSHQLVQLQFYFSFQAVNLCSSSSSSKLFACLDPVLVPFLSCFVCLFLIVVPSCLHVQIQFQLYAVCLFLVLVLGPSYLLARSCSSSSSTLLVCLFLFLVLVPSLVIEKTAQPHVILYFQSYIICLK